MICKKCGKGFVQQKGLINYCSLACRNSKIQTQQMNRLRSEKAKDRWNLLSDQQKIEYRKLRFDKYPPQERLQKLRLTYKLKMKNKSWEQLGIDGRRRRVLQQQENKCSNCGITQWLGSKITLQIDHVDGNNQNNTRENLNGLCPNCHSLTPTWRGRNKPARNGENKISDDTLIEALKTCSNIRQSLLMVGMAAKGANYERAKRLKQKHKI